MAQPQNCYHCKLPFAGKGPVCAACNLALLYATTRTKLPPMFNCTFCGSKTHDTVDCLAYALNVQQQQQKAQLHMAQQILMATRTQRRTARHNYNYTPPLKACPACKGNYLIESKAGSVCSNCRTVIHNVCRNCGLPNTRGLTGDNTQFIECLDCQFLE